MTAAPPPFIDGLAAEAVALARWAALCRVADEQDRRMRRGRALPLDGAGGDEGPITPPPPVRRA
jgi:hypothetical protein